MGFRTNSAQLCGLEHAKEVNTRNTDAEYLYGELEKRGIPAIIMEPLLGRRLSNVHDHIAAQLKQRRPESSVASWAFRFAGSFPDVLTVLSGMTYMEHLQDNLSTYSPFEELTSEEKEFWKKRHGNCSATRPFPVTIANTVCHVLTVEYSGYLTPFQQMHQRRQYALFVTGYELSQSPPSISYWLRPFCSVPATG